MISGCLGGLALIGNILLEGQATTTRDGDKLFSQKCPQNLGKEKITGYSLQIREQKLKNAEIFFLFPTLATTTPPHPPTSPPPHKGFL